MVKRLEPEHVAEIVRKGGQQITDEGMLNHVAAAMGKLREINGFNNGENGRTINLADFAHHQLISINLLGERKSLENLRRRLSSLAREVSKQANGIEKSGAYGDMGWQRKRSLQVAQTYAKSAIMKIPALCRVEGFETDYAYIDIHRAINHLQAAILGEKTAQKYLEAKKEAVNAIKEEIASSEKIRVPIQALTEGNRRSFRASPRTVIRPRNLTGKARD